VERPAPSVFVRRRLVAAAVLLLIVVGVAAAAGAFSGGGGDAPTGKGSPGGGTTGAPAPPELPGGGRRLLPDRRVVAFYGAPQDPELGTLGIGTPEQAARRLGRQARAYARPHRPVLPALELIASVAAADPGEDGMYRTQQTGAVIDRYLRAARRHGMLLLLDVQPGRSDFFTEAVRLQRWLREPDVGLALDPEWRVTGNEVPGQVIGHADPRELNATTAWLDGLAAAHDLPQKLLVVHQFTDDMLDAAQLQPRSRLAMVLNADGFGTPSVKVSKYRAFSLEGHGFGHGFKLFFHEDVGLMTPRQVLRLRPAPDVVVYE
jgi:hypothetical protein